MVPNTKNLGYSLHVCTTSGLFISLHSGWYETCNQDCTKSPGIVCLPHALCLKGSFSCRVKQGGDTHRQIDQGQNLCCRTLSASFHFLQVTSMLQKLVGTFALASPPTYPNGSPLELQQVKLEMGQSAEGIPCMTGLSFACYFVGELVAVMRSDSCS
jgi:hypothetical protein